jgi:hypothetical protein
MAAAWNRPAARWLREEGDGSRPVPRLGRGTRRHQPYNDVVVVTVEVVVEGPARPPAGVPVIVQVRDTAEQDAPAKVLGEARDTISGRQGAGLATVQVVIGTRGAEPTVWAHVDVDGNGRVSRGDYVTVQSYPVPAGSKPRVRVAVKRV